MDRAAEYVNGIIGQTKCRYRQLGASGVKVSVPILGMMGYGDKRWVWDWVKEEDEALPLLKAAWDRGVNTWDTANIFSNGASERLIGKAINKYDIPRKKLVIITKIWATVGEVPPNVMAHGAALRRTKEYVHSSGLSRSSIINAVDASLERLGTGYIDILQIHRSDDKVSYEETMRALDDLIRAGKVRYIAASSMWTHQFVRMQHVAEKHGWTKFIAMENHYSLLYREEEREMNRYCRETGVALTPWSPLCRGHLARPLEDSKKGITLRSKDEVDNGSRYVLVRPDSDEAIISRVEAIAKAKNWTMADVALAWINKRVTSPVVGVQSVQQLDEIIEACNKEELTDEEEKYLEEPYVPRAISGHS